MRAPGFWKRLYHRLYRQYDRLLPLKSGAVVRVPVPNQPWFWDCPGLGWVQSPCGYASPWYVVQLARFLPREGAFTNPNPVVEVARKDIRPWTAADGKRFLTAIALVDALAARSARDEG